MKTDNTRFENIKTVLCYDIDKSLHLQLEQLSGQLDLNLIEAHNDVDVFHLYAQFNLFAFLLNPIKVKTTLESFIFKLKEDSPEVPIYAILNKESPFLESEIMQLGIRRCIKAPIDIDVLKKELKSIIPFNKEFFDVSDLISEQRQIIIPSDFSIVVSLAKNILNNSVPINDTKRSKVLLGLVEMLNNAIEHGNLDIGYELKNRHLKDRSYPALIQTRANSSEYQNRCVSIQIEVDKIKQKTLYKITDEGKGFDPKKMEEKLKANTLEENGRGIGLTRYAFDDVSYNSKGNEVSLVYNWNNEKKARKF